MLYVFDVDGCISDDRWRLGKIDHDAPVDRRWTEYHNLAIQDKPMNKHVYDAARADTRTSAIVAITAMPEQYRACRKEWLKANGFAFDGIYMRRTEDRRGAPEMKSELIQFAMHNFGVTSNSVIAYDDREDVLEAYAALGIDARRLAVPRNAADILGAMASTYRERNAVYGDNYLAVGKLLGVLFPDGVKHESIKDPRFHLFCLTLMKLSRYAHSKFTHQDSVHDAAVYCAMSESLHQEQS